MTLTRKPSLLIFYQYDPLLSSIGGIQTVVNNFFKYSPDDFNVGIVGISGCKENTVGIWHEREVKGQMLKFLPVVSVEDDDVRSIIPTTLKYTMGLFKYRNLIRKADFMHFHRLEPSVASLGLKAKKTLFIHNDIQQQIFGSDKANSILWRSFPKAYFAVENVLIDQFNSVLSCNSESLKFYKSRYPHLAPKMDFVKNTVDAEIFSFADFPTKENMRRSLAKELNVSSETQFIFFAGRFHPQKDPLLLIRSMSHLKEQPVHLLLAGAGELEASMKSEVANLDLGKQVTFLGRLGATQMARIHQLSSAFVLTSLYEGLPMVALEALACGTPVVTTNCGETPKLLTPSSGIVVFSRESSAIAQSIKEVLEYRRNFSPEACAQASEPYSAKSVVGKIYASMRQTVVDESINSVVFS